MSLVQCIASLLLAAVLCVGCVNAAPTADIPAVPAETTVPTPTATSAPTRTPAPTAAPTETPVPAPSLWLDPSLDHALSEPLRTAALAAGIELADALTAADITAAPAENGEITWLYAPVVPFPTLADEITSADLRAFWAGDPAALGMLSEDKIVPTLYVTTQTLAALTALWGPPSEAAPIQTAAEGSLINLAWNARPHAWAVAPFESLEPRWKVLHLDGLSLLNKSVTADDWPLTLHIGIQGADADPLRAAAYDAGMPHTNRDTAEMTVLMMTGVTAMVRSIAYRMETKGILYPGELISATLASADLTHISNELPFFSGCPYPDPVQQELVFCSSPRYIELLRAVGTDIIELTGNHFQDYGDAATLETLAMYNEEGWPYYGGGANLVEAERPITLTSNGNSFSFIGCNPVGPNYAWATASHPGAAPCDYEAMHSQLKKLSGEVDVPIATFQYHELYQYEATEQQKADFRAMADAGAQIVSGSQAHHPQAIEFRNGAFIHYGLGNLFFDQMQSLGTRQEFIDVHIIYRGRHISTELLTNMLEDYAQPRPMTPDERRELLQSVFTASGW